MQNESDLGFLSGGGTMGAAIRAHDWDSSPLGPPRTWPAALRVTVRLMLDSPQPMYLGWGPQLVCFCNDAYCAASGDDGSAALGKPAREAWHQAWHIIGPQIDQVLRGSGGILCENTLIPLRLPDGDREVYWTYSYSPIRDDTAPAGIGGILAISSVTTATVVGQQLRERELRQLRGLLEQVPSFVLILRGPEHHVEFCNTVHRVTFGSSDWVGKPLREAIPSLEGQGIFELLDRVYATGVSEQLEAREIRFRRKVDEAEESRVVKVLYTPWRDGSGRIAGVFCNGFDVTEAHQARSALTESEARYREIATKFRTLFEQRSQFAGILDLDGRVVEVNRTSLEASGAPEAEVLGRCVWDCSWWNRLPEVQEQVRQGCALAATGATYHGTCRYHAADGSVRWMDLHIAPVFDTAGKVVLLNPSAVDITGRIAAERELQRSREASERQTRLYEAILTNTPDAVYAFDRQRRFIYANDIMVRIWGRSREQTLGMTCLELGYPQWEAEMHDREIDRVIATRQPVRGQVSHPGSSGVREYDYIFVPVLDAQGKVEAVAGTSRDVTELRQAEHELRRIAEALADADRRKTQFLAMLAHELRNPLAPIGNGLALIRAAGNPGEPVRSAVAIMQRQVSHMVRLIDDLIDISRISQGSISLRIEPTDLGTVVQQAIDTCRPLFEAAQQELAVELPPEPVVLPADPVRLTQVIANLLNNASKYSPRRGRIVLRAVRDGRQVLITVSDHGIGIPPDMLQRVFEMFTQVDRAAEHSRSGLGIGLALVKTLVELHGGSVEAHSAGLGLGSDLVVRLSLEAAADAGAGTPADADTQFGGLRVLVVDDNRDAADSMAAVLQLLGNQVRIAYDGLDAVQAAASFAPELVLLDIGLPGIDGNEACRRILAQSTHKPLMVAVTGWSSDEERLRSNAAGFTGYLV